MNSSCFKPSIDDGTVVLYSVSMGYNSVPWYAGRTGFLVEQYNVCTVECG